MLRQHLAATCFFILVQISWRVSCQMQSPCPKIFRYVKDERTGNIEGRIEIRGAPNGVPLHIKLGISFAAALPSRNSGRLELAVSKQEAILAVQEGRALVYRVELPVQRPVPVVTSILFNGQEYCAGRPAIGNTVASMGFEHTLFPPRVVQQAQSPVPTSFYSKPTSQSQSENRYRPNFVSEQNWDSQQEQGSHFTSVPSQSSVSLVDFYSKPTAQDFSTQEFADQMQSPCPDVFKYVRNERTGDLEGQIEIYPVPDGVALRINIMLSIAAILPTEYVGKLELAVSKEQAIKEIQQGRPLVYRVTFPLKNPVPVVTKILFNDQEHCSGKRAVGVVATSMGLEHTLFPPGVSPQDQNYGNQAQTSPFYPKPTRPSSNPYRPAQTTYYRPPSPYRPAPTPNKPAQTTYYTPPSPYRPAPTPYKPAPTPYKPAQTTYYTPPAPYRPAPTPYKPAQTTYQPAPTPHRPAQSSSQPSSTSNRPAPTFNWNRPPNWSLPVKPSSTSNPRPSQSSVAIAEHSLPSNRPNERPSNSNEFGTCGRPAGSDANLLVALGDKTEPGEWPWLVAIFVAKIKLEFQCGGSLISDRHVLTAAHCLINDNKVLPTSTVLAVVGRHKLRAWSDKQAVISEISEFHLHSEYMKIKGGFDNDLAVMTLRETVTFGRYIMPICLWSGSTNIDEIVGKIGFVAGWGRDELENPMTEEPRKKKVPIVSQEECLRSNKDFVTYTSNRTLCAGARNGSGPCNGDSGGGLVIWDSVMKRYHLRGVVSLSLLDRADGACDLKNFVVYTDAAKYQQWIKSKMTT